ncbi:MAG TPA: topoisomerase DNA-binding C4 zinc finger domain-containing protein, partial [bacterium]|nr:topoisomerase DNA-binding C4 zinc finger domain-containing protein [bacterium]
VDVTRYDISGDDNYIFRTTGSVVRFDGYLKVYNFKSSEEAVDENDNKEVEKPLPELDQSEPLDLSELKPEQHFTKPPARYNEASLVRELEERGIGRPSTYVPIIETLKKRGYTSIVKRAFHPTKWGLIVNDLLTLNFPDIVDFNFTARMEEELDGVESGNKNWSKLVEDFYGPFSKELEKAAKTMKYEEKVDEKCPECGADLAVKPGKYGLFLGCSKYPECKFTRPYEVTTEESDGGARGVRVKPEPSDEKCDKCGADMLIRKGKYGKFLACSAYPKCRNIKPISVDVTCPKEGCGGKLVQRRSKKGRTFYGCSNYPKCDFVTWSQPVEGESCPSCGGILVMTKAGGKSLKKCIREGCGKTISMEEQNSAEAES